MAQLVFNLQGESLYERVDNKEFTNSQVIGM
jgi:hypothetical protein